MKKVWIAAGTCLFILAGIVSLVIFSNNKTETKKDFVGSTSVQNESGQESTDKIGAELPSKKEENPSKEDSKLYALQSDKGQNRKLPKYKGLLIEASTAEVSEESVEQAIQELLFAHADITWEDTGKVRLGIQIKVDYQVTREGEKVIEEDDRTLTIGSNTLPAEVEQALIGKSVKDTVTHLVKEEQATYQVTVKQIAQVHLPKKDDAFVQRLTGYGDCQSVQQLEDYIRGQLREEKILEAIWKNLINSCTFEVSEEETNKKKESVQKELEEEAESYEVDVDTFLQYRYAWRKTQEEFVEERALFCAKEEEFVYAVARAEGITRKGMPEDMSEADYITKQVKRLVVDEVKVKGS